MMAFESGFMLLLIRMAHETEGAGEGRALSHLLGVATRRNAALVNLQSVGSRLSRSVTGSAVRLGAVVILVAGRASGLHFQHHWACVTRVARYALMRCMVKGKVPGPRGVPDREGQVRGDGPRRRKLCRGMARLTGVTAVGVVVTGGAVPSRLHGDDAMISPGAMALQAGHPLVIPMGEGPVLGCPQFPRSVHLPLRHRRLGGGGKAGSHQKCQQHPTGPDPRPPGKGRNPEPGPGHCGVNWSSRETFPLGVSP